MQIKWGTCGNCGSAVMPCECMRKKAIPEQKRPPKPLIGYRPTRGSSVAQAMREAGWHNDEGRQAHLFLESHFNSEESKLLWNEGRQARLDGLPCNCRQCRDERAGA